MGKSHLLLFLFWPMFYSLCCSGTNYFNLCICFSFPFSTVLSTCEVTPAESSKTWGRSSVLPKEEGEEEEKRGQKKKGRTWGPSSLCHKELGSGEEG